jgi:hypothetical protein
MLSRNMAAERSAGAARLARRSAGAQPGSSAVSSRRINRLKDEVYREMLRLESNCPGSEMGLALALLRAALERDSLSEDVQVQEWLTEVCRLGLKMIETSLNEGASCASANNT